DGVRIPSFPGSDATRAFIPLRTDLQPAMHRVEIKSARRSTLIDLLTEDASRMSAELLSMIRVVTSDLPRFRGAFWYLDSENRPRRAVDPVRVATFIRDNLTRIESAVQSIDDDPMTSRTVADRLQPFGHRINVRATGAFLARHPDLLRPTTPGIVH